MAQNLVKKLKKGELLFNEGDASRSMYFVQSGLLRLYKKKGDASIELGTIHKGEVVGEMGFLDGGPRSASAEAMHDTVLSEITNASLVEQLKVLPPWLMVLLKTIVNRLRSANNKIRQLETASMAYTYGSEGPSTVYQFMNVYDVLKICSALLLVGSRSSEKTAEGGTKVLMARLTRYASQIMGMHNNKIMELLDILEKSGYLTVNKAVLDKIEIDIKDLNLLEGFVAFVNEENLKEHAKKLNFSVKAVMLMGLIVKHSNLFPPDSSGICEVNLAKISELEKPNFGGREPFRVDEVGELVKTKLATDVAYKDSVTQLTKVNIKELVRMYKVQSVLKDLESMNDKKREQAARSAVGSRR